MELPTRVATALIAAALGLHLLMLAAHGPTATGHSSPHVTTTGGQVTASATPTNASATPEAAVAQVAHDDGPDAGPATSAAACLVVLATGLLVARRLFPRRFVVSRHLVTRIVAAPWQPARVPTRAPPTPVSERVVLRV
jgi:hypothetical protein